jgi:hypothetical protein
MRTEGGTYRIAVLQVLAVEPRAIVVGGLPDSVDEQRGLFNVSAQPLEVWRPPDNADDLPYVLDALTHQQPQNLDTNLITGTEGGCREGLRKWRAAPDSAQGVAAGGQFKLPPFHTPASRANPRTASQVAHTSPSARGAACSEVAFADGSFSWLAYDRKQGGLTCYMALVATSGLCSATH